VVLPEPGFRCQVVPEAGLERERATVAAERQRRRPGGRDPDPDHAALLERALLREAQDDTGERRLERIRIVQRLLAGDVGVGRVTQHTPGSTAVREHADRELLARLGVEREGPSRGGAVVEPDRVAPAALPR